MYTPTKKLLIVYLKFKFNLNVFLFSKSDSPVLLR